MSLRSRSVALAVVLGAVAASIPIGGPAAADCSSHFNIQMFFRYGTSVDVSSLQLRHPVTGAPINRVTAGTPTADYAFAACFVGEESGTGLHVDAQYVLPGALQVSGRDNISACRDTAGSIVGLGANYHEAWTYPRSVVDGSCDTTVGTGGAGTPYIALDPTQLGVIRAATGNGSIEFRTLNNV
ncbi:MAG TPA: hypothetical protein VM840_11130 [Actinomycetota bacterium]|nr:hypothetical protein [Actinomycetota bacterium]